jgi:hypothetical protein
MAGSTLSSVIERLTALEASHSSLTRGMGRYAERAMAAESQRALSELEARVRVGSLTGTHQWPTRGGVPQPPGNLEMPLMARMRFDDKGVSFEPIASQAVYDQTALGVPNGSFSSPPPQGLAGGTLGAGIAIVNSTSPLPGFFGPVNSSATNPAWEWLTDADGARVVRATLNNVGLPGDTG